MTRIHGINKLLSSERIFSIPSTKISKNWKIIAYFIDSKIMEAAVVTSLTEDNIARIWNVQHDFAIEVQGPQHEKYIEFFHRDPNNFIKQQARDQLKKELCEENQISLRYFWYYEDPYVVIPEHLRELGHIE
ncbi:hypothetical protein RhiirA4_463307 [Rhizophagus irregularis]|uniref:Uncharacterized protein n=1 Tax=Rhizophagus irregularis TaxID=588596 RepID=A0A2I1GMP4_9GLOM|nr:hypothetical protein RhiirA4_463307 [Rhizophagus irregularis]